MRDLLTNVRIPTRLKKRVRRSLTRTPQIARVYDFALKQRVRFSKRLSDKDWARRIYRENTGFDLDLENPKGLNEKLWFLKLNNRDPLLTRCSDKVAVAEFLEERDLAHLMVPRRGVFNNIDDIDFAELESPFFVKLNTGSGVNAFVEDGRRFDAAAFRRRVERSLRENYYWYTREWNYRDIEPKILVEDVLPDRDSLMEYRIFCFDGKARLIFLDRGASRPDGTHSPLAVRNIFDRDFRPVNAKVFLRPGPNDVSRPKNLEEMMNIADRLSDPFVFARVDLYNIHGRIYFGEITFYPGGAMQVADPYSYELEWGSWIDLQSPKIIRTD